MKFALFTTASGLPILIGEQGLIIEPEPSTGRSIVVMQHNQRDTKSRITVTEKFEDIVASLGPTLILSKEDREWLERQCEKALAAEEEPRDEPKDIFPFIPHGRDEEIIQLPSEDIEPIVVEAATRTKSGRKRK